MPAMKRIVLGSVAVIVLGLAGLVGWFLYQRSAGGKPDFFAADPVLLTAEGKVNAELLRFDGIHLNDKGYAAWTSLIKPALLAAYGPAAGTVQ